MKQFKRDLFIPLLLLLLCILSLSMVIETGTDKIKQGVNKTINGPGNNFK